jgi:hypothetical protein
MPYTAIDYFISLEEVRPVWGRRVRPPGGGHPRAMRRRGCVCRRRGTSRWRRCREANSRNSFVSFGPQKPRAQHFGLPPARRARRLPVEDVSAMRRSGRCSAGLSRHWHFRTFRLARYTAGSGAAMSLVVGNSSRRTPGCHLRPHVYVSGRTFGYKVIRRQQQIGFKVFQNISPIPRVQFVPEYSTGVRPARCYTVSFRTGDWRCGAETRWYATVRFLNRRRLHVSICRAETL